MALLVDILVAALLAATLSYCVLLNRRLAALRDDKGELRDLIRGLSSASQRAEAGVASLRVAAEQIGVGLQEETDRARELRDDLAYMLERGGALADRLENAIRARRDEGPPSVAARPSRPPERPSAPAGRTDHRGARPRIEPTPAAVAPPEPTPARATPGAPPAAAAAAPGRVASFPSRVERDLRRVLEGRR